MVRFIDDENLVYLASTDKSYVNYDLAKELKNQLEYCLGAMAYLIIYSE